VTRLQGKVALVTGAARGIGAAIAREFVSEGSSVVLGDLLDDEGRSLAAELGPNAHYEHLDVRNEEQWSIVVAMTTSRFGPPTILVNNAAVLQLVPLLRCELDTYRQVIETNQLGCFLGMRAAGGAMRTAGGGSIINVGSVDGTQGTPGTTAYAATKWALRGMTKVAAAELGPLGIRVNIVNPGGIVTPMTSLTTVPGMTFRPVDQIVSYWPLRRMGDPTEVARAAVFLGSDDSSFVTGAELTVDGGATAGPPYAIIDY
jgi:3alpha(or 20beta)-hydroxysteroid dehydrogenase